MLRERRKKQGEINSTPGDGGLAHDPTLQMLGAEGCNKRRQPHKQILQQLDVTYI